MHMSSESALSLHSAEGWHLCSKAQLLISLCSRGVPVVVCSYPGLSPFQPARALHLITLAISTLITSTAEFVLSKYFHSTTAHPHPLRGHNSYSNQIQVNLVRLRVFHFWKYFPFLVSQQCSGLLVKVTAALFNPYI